VAEHTEHDIKLTEAEIQALEDASWERGRRGWIAAIEQVIADRLTEAGAE